jgi:hypothetical protein
LKTQTDKSDIDAPFYEQRDLELENIIGNLMVAEYQVDRLRSRLLDKASGFGRSVAGYYQKTDKQPASTHVFEHKGKLYKVTVKLEEVKKNEPDNSDLV